MKKKSGFSKILGAKGAGTVVTAFIGLIIIYIAFGILNPKVGFHFLISRILSSFNVKISADRYRTEFCNDHR